MPSYRHCVLLLIVFTVTLLPIVGQDDAPLFEATFDDNTLPDTLNIQYGTYEILDGALDYQVQNGGFLVIPEGTEWTDYALEVDMQIIDGSVWLQTRTGGDLCSGYYLTVAPSRGTVDLSLSDVDCNFTVLADSEIVLSDDGFVARIEVEGEQIRGYINDELILEAVDAQAAKGYPIINVFPIEGEAHVIFDSIRITQPSIPENAINAPEATPEPDVEPSLDIELPAVNEIPLEEDPLRMIEILQELELVPNTEGDLYTDDNVVIARIGAWFEPLFEGVEARHAVMSADISFLPNSDGETCLLSAWIERDKIGLAQRYLDVGVNSLDEVFIGETDADGVYSQATQDGLLTPDGGHFLFVIYGNRLSVYVNSRAVFQNIEVTPRAGSFGVSATATSSYTLCHVTNIWAYTFSD